jgi:hypothetical protein
VQGRLIANYDRISAYTYPFVFISSPADQIETARALE